MSTGPRTNTKVRQELAPYIETLRQKLDASGKETVKLDDVDGRIAREAARSLKSWRESQEGRATLDALGGYNSLQQIRAKLGDALQGPHFSATLELIAEQRAQAQARGASSIPYQTISLGIMAQGDVGVGVYGAIGYAADLSDIENSSVIFLSGAIIEGVELGAAGGVQIGVWKDKTEDLQGYYNAQEVAVTDTAGVIVWLYESSTFSSLKGIAVDLAAGVEDGASEAEVYILTIDIQHSPVYQERRSHFLILTSLVCDNGSEVGHDEISLRFEPDGDTQFRYPTWGSYSMSDDNEDPDHQWAVGRSVYFDDSVAVKLYEGNDQLCDTETLKLSDFNGPGSSSQLHFECGGLNEVSYTLTAKFVF